MERGVTFRLPDGTTLVSDHYHPPPDPEGRPVPTLLVRQPYGRTVATTVVCPQPAWLARHGYRVVIQDVRGRGDSGGTFDPFRHEADDGAATVEWLAREPGADGRVGMYGFSYQGLTQLLAAVRQPEGLRCIAPWQTVGDLYHGWFYQHGALRLAGTVGWAAQMLRHDARRRRNRRPGEALEAAWSRLPALFAHTPYGGIPELTARGLPGYYRDWVTRRAPGPWWAARDISTRYDRIRVPGLHVLGWFDTYLHGSALLYEALRTGAGSPEARDHQYLVAGPWVHIPWGRHVGETDLGPAAELDTDRLLLRWFNHWLKDTGEFDGEPRIRSFTLGSNTWHTPASLDLGGTGGGPRQRWHLRSQGRANSSRGDGVLDLAAPSGEEPRDHFVHEPEVPVLSPGPQAAPGQFNTARAAQLNNVLVYTSAPLAVPVHLLGRPRASLAAVSRLEEADLYVRLVRVLPDGRALNLTHGIARSRWLFGGAGLRPGRVRRWEFPLDPTDAWLAPGERIRVEVAGSCFPTFDRQPGSGVSPERASARDWRQNHQQILHTAADPSWVELPTDS